MSSSNPPYPYYNGIPFNPSFFTSDSGSGLTENEANAKYLRKTVPDEATALETFNGGIVTPSLSSTGSLDIVIPNALASDVLNVGVVSRNISGQVHHYSDGDNCVAGANVHLNNGINNASNTNISNGTTTTGQVNIMSGASSTGTINIGQTTTTLALKGATSILGTTNINTTLGGTTSIGTANTGTTNIKGRILNILNDVITGASPYPTINIGRNNTAGPDSTTTNIDGTVNIGFISGGDTTINQLYTDWIYAVTDASTLNVGVNLTTGDPINNNLAISIGENLTSGKIEIGKNQTTGTITLGSSTTTNAIKGTTSILGATTINNSGGLNTTIGTVSTGSVNIRGATVLIADSTAVNIQSTSISDNTKSITMGSVNGGFSTLTSINGRLTTAGTTNINTSGTSNTSIGVVGSTTAILGATNINTSGTGNTTIGTAGNTTAIRGTTDINITSNLNTTIGTVSAGTSTIRGATVNVSGTTNAITGITNINTSGTSNTSIGVAGSTTAILGPTNINTSGGSITTIGNISAGGIINLSSPDIRLGGTTTIVDIGALTGAGINRLNKPLTPMYETVAITSDKIGYTVYETLTLGQIDPYSDRNMFASVTLPKGVWLIQCTARINSDNASGTNINDYIFWCRDSIDYNTRPIFMFGNSNTLLVKTLTNSTSAIITSDGTVSYSIAFYMTYTSGAPDIIRLQTTGDYKSSVKRTRIA